uniref:Uncharacterized protein n=1 Tax=Myoviridae sp. ctBCv9 TaxID=2825045 RepID=A0A8S5U6D0_9CAUD|nr:MAG TPA: hypothetical protein [Myoviridae sp. ctBCv9]
MYHAINTEWRIYLLTFTAHRSIMNVSTRNTELLDYRILRYSE